MIQVLYQNPGTGEALDITASVTDARWTTKRVGYPAAVELTALGGGQIPWEHGGIVRVRDGDMGLFLGYVFKMSRNEKRMETVTAYDQTRYLKNKETYVFEDRRADQVLAEIAADFGLKVGELANTGYVIPAMIEDGQTLFDIILKALDLTLINTGKMFCLWDDYGLLCISDVAESRFGAPTGEDTLTMGYTYDSDIDSETYNKIKLVRDNRDTGRRDVYLFQDSDNMRLWGILQSYEKVDEEMNEGQIKARGDQMLELYNRPKRSFDVSALSDLSVRAGRALYIGLSDLGISQFFIVEEAEHDLLKGTMALKLKVV